MIDRFYSRSSMAARAIYVGLAINHGSSHSLYRTCPMGRGVDLLFTILLPSFFYPMICSPPPLFLKALLQLFCVLLSTPVTNNTPSSALSTNQRLSTNTRPPKKGTICSQHTQLQSRSTSTGDRLRAVQDLGASQVPRPSGSVGCQWR